MKFISNINPKTLSKASIWACLVGAVATTVMNVVSTIRHDKRDKKLYATLQYKAENCDKPKLPELETENDRVG